MAIKPNREGINPKYINKDGGVITPPDTATQSKVATLEGKTSTLETKVGNLYFRVSEDKPQYKNGESGEWSDFSSGGGADLLWTNPSPTVSKFNTDVTIPNLTNYSSIIIEFGKTTSDTGVYSKIYDTVYNGTHNYITATSSDPTDSNTRAMLQYRFTGNTINFINVFGGSAINSSPIIRIYGLKFTI